MNREYDIAIIGAGMAGATLAALLADSGLRILLVDASEPETFDPARVAMRVSALAPASARILDHAGVWQRIAGQRAGPYRHMQVWDASGPGTIEFDAAALGIPVLGWIVENCLVQQTLLQRLETSGAVDVACPLELDEAGFEADAVCLRFGTRRTRARLLVGADGAESRVRALAGIDVHARDYAQRAVVAVVSTREAHRETAWQCFLPGGPVALLPLADGRCSLVWTQAEPDAEHTLTLDDAAFCHALGDALDHRLGEITATGPRASFPLQRLHAREYVRPRCALIGDAAHVVHPLAGQGANLGLLDAAALAETLLDRHETGADAGAWRSLRRYARWRRAHNLLVQEALDGLHHLFGNERPAVAAVRGWGLQAVAALGPVKRLLAEFAAGERGDLPACAQARPDFRP